MDIEYIARLARLKLTCEEKNTFGMQIPQIIRYVEKLNSLNTDGVKPTAHVMPLKNVWREDEVKDSLPHASVEQIMPEGHSGFFKVPPAIE